MRQIHKTMLSILLTILSFGTVSYLEYADILPEPDVRLYNRSRVREVERKLAMVGEISARYSREILDRLHTIAAEPYTESVYSLDQDRAEVARREDAFGILREAMPEIASIRFVAPGFEKIHYSSIPSDLKRNGETLREYHDMDEAETDRLTERVRSNGSDPVVLASPDGSGFICVIPVRSGYGSLLGYGLFELDLNGLTRELESADAVSGWESLYVTDTMLLVLDSDLFGTGIIERIENREFVPDAGVGVELSVSDTGSALAMIAGTVGDRTIGTVIDERMLHLDTSATILIPVSFCLTCFLLFFCLLNLRRSREAAVSQRLSRFKGLFLQEFLARPPVDAEILRGELVLHRNAIFEGITRDLGGRNRKVPAAIERRYDTFFSELVSLCSRLGSKEDRTEAISGQLACVFERARTEGVLSEVGSDRISELPACAQNDGPGTLSGGSRQQEHGHAAEFVEGSSAPEQAEEIADCEVLEEFEESAELEELPKQEEQEEAEELEELEEPEELEELEEVEECGDPDSAEAGPEERTEGRIDQDRDRTTSSGSRT